MSLTATINYDNSANFTFDSTKVQFNGSNASLKLAANPGLVFSQNFASSSGFTFNASATEFTGGVMRQKDARPANESLYAQLTSIPNANWANGSTTGTATGSITYGVNGANFSAAPDQHLDYSAAGGNYNSQVGTTRFRYTPAFTGSPAGNERIFIGFQTVGSANAALTLYIAAGGGLATDIYDSTGTLSSSNSLGGYSPVSGTTVEMEIDYDFNAGATRVFVNGTQVGSTITDTITRGTVNIVRFGGTIVNTGETAHMSIRDAEQFSTVQHTSNYTAPSPLPPATIYITDTVSIPNFVYPGPGHVLSYSASSATSVNAPQFTVNGKWWNGAAWVASSGAFAQSNPIAVINTNIPTLPVSDTTSAQVVWAPSNTQQMVISLFTITYSGQAYPTSDPSILVNSSLEAGGLVSLSAVDAASGGDSVQFILTIQSQDTYWNGSAWVNSNGSLAQSNSAAVITTNAPTLNISQGVNLQIKALLHSNSGSTTPTITSVTVVYNFEEPQPGEPNRCVAFINLNDELGQIGSVESAVLVVELEKSFLYGSRIITPFRRTFAFNQSGYAETTSLFLQPSDPTAFDGLVETQSLGISPYKIGVQYSDGTGAFITALTTSNIQIPNQLSVDLSTLLVLG